VIFFNSNSWALRKGPPAGKLRQRHPAQHYLLQLLEKLANKTHNDMTKEVWFSYALLKIFDK
jgi:hypothetical protein